MDERPKHTPGPWRWEYSDEECTRPIALAGPGKDVILASEDATGPRAYVSEADARLIAAAPDLYAACKASMTAIRETIRRPMGVQPDSATEALDLIATALDKAEGREP